MDMSSLSDEELLSRFLQSKDHCAFHELVFRHSDMVYGVCRRVLGHHHDAQDAYQATFLVLAVNASKIRRRHALAGWLFGVACRMARKALARKVQRKEKTFVGEEALVGSDSTFAAISRQRDEEILVEEVNALPESYKEVVVLRYFERKPTLEVAAQLGLSTGAVKGRLERAKRVLSRRLRLRGISVASALTVLLAEPIANTAAASTLANKTSLLGYQLRFGESIDGVPHSSVSSLATKEPSILTSTTNLVTACSITAVVCLAVLIFPPTSSQLVAQDLTPLLLVKHAENREQTLNSIEISPLASEVRPDGNVVAMQDDGHITSVAFSPSGRYLVGASFDRTVKLWNAVDGKLRATLTGHTGYVRTVAFSPDEKLVVSGSDDHTVRIWNSETGKLINSLPNHPGTVNAVAFADNGSILVSVGSEWPGDGDDNHSGFVRFSKLDTGATIRNIDLQAPTMVVAASKDLVVIGDAYGVIHVYRVNNDNHLRTWKGHERGILALCFSPDGEQLATGSHDKTVRLWNVETETLVRQLDGHTGEVRSLAFSPNGDHIASGTDAGYLPTGPRGLEKTLTGQTLIWDASNGELLKTLTGACGQTWSVAYSNNGLLARCDNELVEVLDARTSQLVWSARYE